MAHATPVASRPDSNTMGNGRCTDYCPTPRHGRVKASSEQGLRAPGARAIVAPCRATALDHFRSSRMTRIVLALLATLLFGSAAHAAGPVAAGGCGSQAKVPADQRVTNTARWTTASESDTFGYDVYRSDSE